MISPEPDAVTGGHAGGGRGGRSSRGGHSPLFMAVAGTVAVLLFATFVVLGTWQLKRRVWKLDLIARVEQRVHAPPAAPPGSAEWPRVSAATDEYRHVTVTGTFLDESQTLVQAVTELGAGYWVLTPLRTADGSVVLVNRGFMPADDRDRVARAAIGPTALRHPADTPPASTTVAASTTVVTGLLRMTEPRGAFLRHNDAAANHWYSRDVQAIAAARGLTHVAPYFVDADGSSLGAASAAGAAVAAGAASAVVPIGGLTVITFHNSHLVYAITWYTLALMVAVAIWLGTRNDSRT